MTSLGRGRPARPIYEQQRLHAAGFGDGELRRRREPEKVGFGCGGWIGSQRGGELEQRVAWRWQTLQLGALLTGSHGGRALERRPRTEEQPSKGRKGSKSEGEDEGGGDSALCLPSRGAEQRDMVALELHSSAMVDERARGSDGREGE